MNRMVKVKKRVNNWSWRKDWGNLDARRFIVRMSRNDDDEGGELWDVVDMDHLFVIGASQSKAAAGLIADALEYLGLHAICSEFQLAITNSKDSLE